MGIGIVKREKKITLFSKVIFTLILTLAISAFMSQGWYRPLIVQAAEMVTNGIFNGSTGWTLSTVTYDSGTTRTASSGSVLLSASGRNSAVTGTVTQAVSIPAGSTVSGVALYTSLTTSNETTGDNVTVSLRYADLTTVSLLATGELTASSWTVRNATPALTLAQDVDQIIITMNTKAGNSGTATASLWVDEVSVTYAVGVVNPTVLSALPDNQTQGTGPTTVAINGTGFKSGATVTFSGTGVTAGTSSFVNSSQITVPVTVTAGATVGLRNITVTNTDTGTGTGSSLFTVNSASSCTANTPSLSIAPPSSAVAAGANMVYTATVTNNDSGVSCSNVTFNLTLNNSNSSDFSTTAIAPTPLTLAAGGQGTASFTVTAGGGAVDGAQNTSSVGVAASGHSSPSNVTAVTTVNSNNTPLMHSSANLDPANTKGYGSWGAGKDCSWCHSTRSSDFGSNVKLVRSSITTPSGLVRPVVFSRITATATDTQGTFGDDLRTIYGTASRNACEVCHHQTSHHQYSSSKIADRVTNPHYNRQDCVGSCHPHSVGFKGTGCNGCHGDPPVSTATLVTQPEATLALGNPPTSGGSHATHVSSEGMKCLACHSGNTMPSVSKTIQIGFDLNNTNWPGFAGTAAFGSFSGRAPLGGAPAYTFVSSKSGTVVNTSSSYRTSCNVYCHGQWAGANGSINPSWIITDGSQSSCGTCHAATAAKPPATGKHTTHASSSVGNYGFSCTKCHPSSSTFGHVNGSVQWRLSSSSSGLIGAAATYTPSGGSAAISGSTTKIAPSSTYGVCTNIYCHSNVQGANGSNAPTSYTSPNWSDAALGCGGCHLDMDSNAAATGDHVKHAQTYAISCATCHNGYTETSVATATHVNKTIEISFSGNATGTSYSQGSAVAGNGYGTCSTSYCHSSGQSATGTTTLTYPASPPSWGSTTTDCGSCHVNMDSSSSAPGDHVKHAQGTVNFSCATCHNGYTETSVVTGTHVNKTIELSFSGTYASGTTYSQGNGPVGNGFGSCSTSKCHGQGVPVWGGGLYSATVQCENCHGSASTSPFYSTAASGVAPTKVTSVTDTKVGAHTNHLNSATVGLSSNVACTECHGTVTALTNPATHMNGTTTFTWGTLAKTGSLSPGITTGTCSNVYCHGAAMPGGDTTGSDRTPLWTDSAFLSASLDPASCGRCHGFPPSTASGHPSVTAPTSFPTSSCNCHANISTSGNSFTSIFVNKALHINGIYEPAASGCKGCHGSGAAKDVQTEFAKNSHHINKTWANITDADCVVCHAEGSISGGSVSVVANKHGNDTGTKGVVDLYNADNRSTIYSLTLTDLTAKSAAGNTANTTLDTFCFSCHDSNGATAVTIASGFTGTATNTATNPFSEVVGTSDLRNSYDQVKKTFGAAPASLNVYDAFATSNYSNHAVRAARYTTATLSTPYSSLKQAGLLSTSVQIFSGQGTAGVADNSQLHCNDCHSTGYSSHGSANEYLLQTATEENPTTEHLATTSYVCAKCHNSTKYTSGGHGPTNGGDWQPQSNTTAVGAAARIANTAKGFGHATGIACLNCHDGDVGYGGIHGFPNAIYTDGGGRSQNKRRFMPGAGLYKYAPSTSVAGDGAWDMAAPDNKCYTIGTETSMSGCTQHSGGTNDGVRATRRPITY
jgi:predicted CxxxxCH...CXXCH cytochrome family protein